MVRLRRERYQDLLLFSAQAEGICRPGVGVMIQFQAGAEGVEKITRTACAVGSSQVEGPVERPRNARDVTIRDPDGYRVCLSEPIATSLSFDEVMGKPPDES